ncbi:MAG: hypothetical protein PHG00_00330 [Methylococcales bacterium]|nr:hypothetical protein [Methylococcales bacterium]
MPNHQAWSLRELILAAMAVALVFFVNGAVPFLMMPTLGQAVWSMGFAQSFANGPLFDFYAHDFGIPDPAAIAFGLAGAWPASLLIRLGLHPSDAYAAMAALWLGLAMFSAYQIARRVGATRSIALLGAVAWMCQPIIWAHAGYSMVSLGIALLSFYFLATFRLFLIESESPKVPRLAVAIYSAAAIVSVFMDGYSFMMFAVGSSILLFHSYLTRPEIRGILVKVGIPAHVISFGLAYLLYSTYIGKSNFEAQPIDFFRGWGLDLAFIAIPTKGTLWLPDLLGLSLNRSDELYFGDGSVWMTTFSLPVLLLGFVAWWRARRHLKLATGVFLIAVFGFYMALGPSLKINSTKPESLQLSHPRQQSNQMPSELAVAPTGNAWISEKLPGFNVMRASYRWSALGIFAFWLLVMIWMTRTDEKNRRIWLLGLVGMIFLSLPDFQKRWQGAADAREMFQQIDLDLVAELHERIHPDEIVAFIPWRNDFIANYLAPKAGFRTFNIGGDKNLDMAQSKWPPEMLSLGEELNPSKAQTGVKMLIDGSADVLLIPYFHMVWSAHYGLCTDQTTARLSDRQKEKMQNIPGFIWPAERRAELSPVVDVLRKLPYLEVADSPLFATVRLLPEFSGQENRNALLSTILLDIKYPITIGANFKEAGYIFGSGWHALEEHHVWSTAHAQLLLPIPKDCESKNCDAVLHLAVFGASQQHPVTVSFESMNHGKQWNEKIVAISDDTLAVRVPLAGAKVKQEISISVPEATSPQLLNRSSDSRVLGIALQRIEQTN